MNMPERGAVAELKLRHISHNLKQFRNLHAGKIIAVVKANAYGHGIENIVPVLSDCDALAVATIDEAIQVRLLAPKQRIILLEGVFNQQEMSVAVEQSFDVVVHQQYQLELLDKLPTKQQLNIWLKIDTGMNRLGFAFSQADELCNKLHRHPNVKELKLMAHFAQSDDPQSRQTQQQQQLNKKLQNLNLAYSFSNTAAVLNRLNQAQEWARVGIGLFGISPLPKQTATDHNLLPAMNLFAKIIATKTIQAGQSIGYGATHTVSKPSLLGIVGIGYADGYPWFKSGTTAVKIGGQIFPTIGRVSMDMLAIDLSQATEKITVGQRVKLWGENMPAERLAESLQCIPHILTCGITKRVKFYVEKD